MRSYLVAFGTALVILALKTTTLAADPCAKIPGLWSWFVAGDVTFYNNGTLVQGALTGNWVCTNNHVTIVWSHRYTDNLVLSSDGNHLQGTNNVNSQVWGNKYIPTPPTNNQASESCDRPRAAACADQAIERMENCKGEVASIPPGPARAHAMMNCLDGAKSWQAVCHAAAGCGRL
jgi:hypothetical protein